MVAGDSVGYSGEGFAYLQHVVERLTGVNLDVLMTDAVLGPLGMEDSRFVWRDEDEVRVAVGHDRDGRARPRSGASRMKAAAGGMYTTGPDYLRFLAHSLVHHHRQFEPQARIDDDLAWGLGWGIEDGGGGRSIWQWGNDPGYKNFVIGRPADRQGVVVFTNGDRGADVYRDVVRRVLPGPHPSLDTRHRRRWLQATAGRPVDLRPRIDEPGVRRVLEVASRGDDGDLAGMIDRIEDARTSLFGLVVEPSREAHGVSPGTPIACIALTSGGQREAEITAIGVLPEWRHQGIARSLIFAACDHLGLQAVAAQTDADAVDFYRAVGFEMQRPGDRSPGVGLSRWRLELLP